MREEVVTWLPLKCITSELTLSYMKGAPSVSGGRSSSLCLFQMKYWESFITINWGADGVSLKAIYTAGLSLCGVCSELAYTPHLWSTVFIGQQWCFYPFIKWCNTSFSQSMQRETSGSLWHTTFLETPNCSKPIFTPRLYIIHTGTVFSLAKFSH